LKKRKAVVKFQEGEEVTKCPAIYRRVVVERKKKKRR